MCMQYKYQIILLLSFLGCNGFMNAQERQISDYTGELSFKTTVSDEKRIEKGIKILSEADKQLTQAEDLFSSLSELEQKEKISENYEKALKNLQTASELYKEGNLAIYQVFKDKCEAFWTKMKRVQQFAAGVEKGKYYERNEIKHLLRAQKMFIRSLWTDRHE